jgi:hypothetical protein
VGTVLQDPERVPEDSYLRHVKRGLYAELRERFGDLLRTRTGPHGEESFEAATPTPRQRRLVARCLELLTPWNTACLVPAGFDATTQPLDAFRFSGPDPDHEHAIEVNRMHALIDPGCFERLAAGLRLEPPRERLVLPRPFRSSALGGPGGGADDDRERPPRLGSEDLDQLGTLWSGRGASRRTAPIQRVSVRVDGRERFALETAIGARASASLGVGAELVEVWGTPAGAGADEAAVLLAVRLLGLESLDRGRGEEAAEEWTVPLDRGRELRLALWRRGGLARTGQDSPIELRLDASCVEAAPLAAFGRAIAATLRPAQGALAARWIAASAAALALAIGLVVWRAPGEGTAPSASPAEDRAAGGERTRGTSAAGQVATLQTARRIYLGSLEGADGRTVAGLLRQALAATGRFEPTTDIDAADAALKVELVQDARPGPTSAAVGLSLRLVDERGGVLWSTVERGPSWDAVVTRAIDALRRAASE